MTLNETINLLNYSVLENKLVADFSFLQIHPSKVVEYDFVFIFNHKNDAFHLCHNSVLNTLRWYPFKGTGKYDQNFALGSYFSKANIVMICPLPPHYCLSVREKRMLLIKYEVENIDQIGGTRQEMLFKPDIATFSRYTL